ncbi:hypothetical protein CDL15_Pgr017669 [Punica granatum]|uniref:FBD domain-containing protein n=1 Tax=Punica granatum TaxID=22663 RepID=A0A218WWE8_PUNGR|nr:hypothetical protein CDL15_Pgr017669 [Punica granatum]
MIKGGKGGQDDLSGGGRIKQTTPIAGAHGRPDSIALIDQRGCENQSLVQQVEAQVGGLETGDTASNFWEFNRSPCSLSQLKFASFTGTEGTMLEMGFIKFLLLQSHMLQRIEIRAEGDSGGPQLETHFLAFERASPLAKVVYLGDRSPYISAFWGSLLVPKQNTFVLIYQ